VALAVPAVAQAQGRARGRTRAPAIRFAELDRNGDRVIQRSEWNGNDQSFRTHDWNGDGVLSGDEVRIGAEQDARDQVIDPRPGQYEFDDWTARGFTALDRNRDNRISRDEWRFDVESFRRADHNRDGVISRSEFLAEGTLNEDRPDRVDRFDRLDTDRNGRISRSEWDGTAQLFNTLDTNHDGWIVRSEMIGRAVPTEVFSTMDTNNDGIIGFTEWQGSRAEFDQRDSNHDGRLTRDEFNRGPVVETRSTAYQAGYDRGAAEARAQAREDRIQNQPYDPEGQRELETADSGYEPRFGPKAEYQAGYRAGWMRGYPEGWRQS
jgi:Ca2+-binding EF-hand superfamily protein